MHELSIAEAVVEVASRHASGRRVHRIELKVGHLRQVVVPSLRFAFDLLTDGTELAGAELVVEEIPARGRCRDCQVESTMTGFPLRCSRCGGIDMEIVAGEELLVDELELEEEITTERVVHGC
jgi:hydrogenase nickel incorporation protein HypA/HybF